jgi:hypothetical protein
VFPRRKIPKVGASPHNVDVRMHISQVCQRIIDFGNELVIRDIMGSTIHYQQFDFLPILTQDMEKWVDSNVMFRVQRVVGVLRSIPSRNNDQIISYGNYTVIARASGIISMR